LTGVAVLPAAWLAFEKLTMFIPNCIWLHVSKGHSWFGRTEL